MRYSDEYMQYWGEVFRRAGLSRNRGVKVKNDALLEPSEKEIEEAEAWLKERFGPEIVPMQITIPGSATAAFAAAVAAAMARRRRESKRSSSVSH